jgi:hypothetical protein
LLVLLLVLLPAEISLSAHCQPTAASAEYGWPERLAGERACRRRLAPGTNRYEPVRRWADWVDSFSAVEIIPHLLQSWAAAKTAGETALLGQLPILWVDGKPFGQSAVRCGLPAPRHILPALHITLCQRDTPLFACSILL